MRRLLALLTAFLPVLVACPNEPPPAPPRPPVTLPPPPVPPPVQANGRLPALAVPTHYQIDLDVDPAQPRFRGSVRIDVDVPKATPFVVLHGTNLQVTKAVGTPASGASVAATVTSRVAQGGKVPEELLLSFSAPLPAGKGSLTLEYTAPFDDGLAGLYRVKDGDRWYAYTQFEPTDARRAFPCFDEPAFKVPFDLAVTVPKAMLAVGNAPESAREEAGDKTRFRFARTQPIPTYLVALAVGELELKEATRFTRPPVRIVTTKGKANDSTKLALEATSGIVDALAEWFGIPYPYEKLDIVAVPDFRSGAMENPGLVTFREERLLLDPTHASVNARRNQALVIAHELAHQWFGDLVTAAWWNDLWLNEGMATWMESRIVDKWRPALGSKIDAVVSAHEVMDLDGLVSARAVRQPVVSTSDAQEAFDGITYEKGAAVLQTIERWVGEDAFQRGIREYLHDNAFKSVESSRLFAALDKAAGKDVTGMASAYVDKPGVPEVFVHLECEPGSRWHLEMTSQPWRPLGSKSPEEASAPSQSWTIPVCVRVQGEKKDTCSELVAGAPSLLAGRGCPTFVHPNTTAGYYRFSLSEKEFVRLAEGRAQLDVPARVSLLSNAWAAVRAGALEPKAMLAILPLFDSDPARHVVEEIVHVLEGMSDTVVDPEARVAFRKFALARLQKRKKALGWLPAPASPAKGEPSPDDALARTSVLLALADVAEDEATLKEADDLATRWLADPSKVDADAGAVALDIASRRAGAARLTALHAAMKSAKTKDDRTTALKATIGFDDGAELEKALDLTLGDDVHPNEMRYVMRALFGRRKARAIGEAWVRSHWDALRKKLPGRLGGALVRAAAVGCTTAEAEERTAFYGPRVGSIEGAARELAESLEAVSLCAALRDKGTVSFRKAILGRK